MAAWSTDARKDKDEWKPDVTGEVQRDKASKLTIGIGPASTFDLPPRSIDDVLEVLEKFGREPTPALRRIQAAANQSVPDSGQSVAKYRLIRAKANRDLGRFRQAIDDANTALQAEKAGVRHGAYLQLMLLYDELGDYAKAIQYGRKAVELAPSEVQVYLARAILSVVLSFSGRLEEASRELERARSYSPSRRNHGDWTGFLRSMVPTAEGLNLFYRGEYGKAETVLREGIKINEKDLDKDQYSALGSSLKDNNQRVRTSQMRFLALCLWRQGRIAEAESLAREAVTIQAGHFGSYSGQTVEGLGTLTEILADQGRAEDTVKLTRATLQIYDRMGAESDSITRAAVRRALGDSLVAADDWPGALREYEAIERDLGDVEDILLLFQFNLTWAMPAIDIGDPSAALGRLTSIHTRLSNNIGADRYESAEAAGFMASAHHVLGNNAPALAGFRQAMPVLLARTSQSDSEDQTASGRIQRLRFILEHYIDALIAGGRPADVGESFRISNAIRASRVDEALAAAAARAALTDPELASLARSEQHALHQIKALNGLLARSGSRGSSDRQVRDELLSQIQALKQARESILRDIAKQAPEYVRLIDPRPPDVEIVQGSLLADEALITTYTSRRRTHVWVIRKSGAVRHWATELSESELNGMVAELRDALAPDVETLADLPPFDVQLAHSLYARVLKPVEDGWKDAKRLIIAPHGSLATLPLVLLPTKPPLGIEDSELLFSGYRRVPWLVRTHSVSSLPSVSSLLALRATRNAAVAGRPFLGFGDPIFDPSDSPAASATLRAAQIALRAAPDTRAIDSADLAILPRLPDTAEEILSIAEAVGADPSRDVFLQRDANEANVKQLSASGVLADYQVVSFATHGLVAGDLDGLTQPALALSSPVAAGVEGDGLLDLEEILGLRMNADWAVLSACNTAAADGAGAEAVSGLGRAFFYAGTRALLVSNWPVHSASTTYFMSDLFSRYGADPSQSRADYVRQAMLETIENGTYGQGGERLFSYAHPIFWAPFSLVGDGATR